jgi:HD-GYP domain-containing protein (c-di-GMP phosphodiesterase class II)
MFEIIATQDLKLGMFVAELDRPWLGTPFLVEGFLLEDEEQLASLRELCRFVGVDRRRSVGEAYRPGPGSAFQPGRRTVLHLEPGERLYRGRRSLKLPPLVLGEERELAGRRYASVRYEDEQRAEDELPAARSAFQNTRDLLRDLGEQVMAGHLPDMQHMESTVSGLVECVVRNPDSLLWLTRLKRSDNLAYDHALSVSVHLLAFGRSLGLPPDELHMLGMGGLLKDVGIIRLPQDLLHKPAGLTAEERERMRGHVELGVHLLADEAGLAPSVLEIVTRHHERIDGSGYPQRLRDGQIGLYGEMAGLVDSYCAMMAPRPYRPARNSQWIIDEINGMRDSRFTGPVVDEFVQFIGLYPVGTLVELNSGEVGVVFEQNRVRRLKPRIMLLLGPDKTRNPSPGMLNLLNDPLVRDGLPYRIVRTLPPGAYGLDPREFYL